MIPAVLFVLVSSIFLTAFYLRRLIDPACPACTERAWQGSPIALRCARCGWSIEGPTEECHPREELRAA